MAGNVGSHDKWKAVLPSRDEIMAEGLGRRIGGSLLFRPPKEFSRRLR